jgi:hypothetical protein
LRRSFLSRRVFRSSQEILWRRLVLSRRVFRSNQEIRLSLLRQLFQLHRECR